MSRSARMSLFAAVGIAAGLVLAWVLAPDETLAGLLIYLPAGVAVVAGVAAIPGLFGRLRDARWPFAALLPVNALAAVFLVLLLANDFQRRELGSWHASFLALNLLAVAVLAIAVGGPASWRPRARRWGMLVTALGCAGFVFGLLLAIGAALS